MFYVFSRFTRPAVQYAVQKRLWYENHKPPEPVSPAAWRGLVLYLRRSDVLTEKIGRRIISRSLEADSVSLARRRRDMCAY